MSEQTYPPQGVSQELDDIAKVANVLQSRDPVQTEPPKQQAQPQTPVEPEQPNGPATDELTPDDIPDDAPAQPVGDAFEIEIVHDGQQRKLNREDTIKYARQGFDYTQKTQDLATQRKQVESHLQQLAEVQQFVPHLLQEQAQVAALQQQLDQYKGVNWVAYAQQATPEQYAQARAQYDALKESYAQARETFGQKDAAVKQRIAQINAERLQQEDKKLPDLIPSWKDPQKRKAESEALSKHYETKYGIQPQELNQFLSTAMSVGVAYKAWKYDQLMEGKANKVNQLRTAPPVTVPGAKSTNTKQDKGNELMSRLRKTGSVEDAAALLANRWK